MRFDVSVSPDEFDEFVANSRAGSLLQSSSWAKVKGGWDHTLTALRDETGAIVVAGLVLQRALPLGLSFWYLPHGPVLNWDEPEPVFEYLSHLATYAKKNRAVAVRIDPLVALKKGPLDEMPERPDPASLAIGRRIEEVGYRHRGFSMDLHSTLQPRFVPVTFKPEGEFFAALPKKSRTMANNARNKFVEVSHGGKELLDGFVDVIGQTEDEKGISLRSREYYEQILDVYGEDARIYLAQLDIAGAIARYEVNLSTAKQNLADTPENSRKKINRHTDEIKSAEKNIAELREHQAADGDDVYLAGVLMVRFGKSGEMLYAGTNRHYGNIPAQHYMWTEAMADGFTSGLEAISLGGVDGSLDDSLMRFKSRFLPTIVEKIGEFQLNIIPPVAKAIDWYLARR